MMEKLFWKKCMPQNTKYTEKLIMCAFSVANPQNEKKESRKSVCVNQGQIDKCDILTYIRYQRKHRTMHKSVMEVVV